MRTVQVYRLSDDNGHGAEFNIFVPLNLFIPVQLNWRSTRR